MLLAKGTIYIRVMLQKTLTVISGTASIGLVVFLWLVVLAPVRWNLRFPGGLHWMAICLVASVVFSVLAWKYGGRAWLVALFSAIFTFIYIGFVMRFPLV